MGLKNTGKFCGHCQRQVMAQGSTPNHLLHLFLSIITAGLWIIMWIIISIGSTGGWRCTQCGGRV